MPRYKLAIGDYIPFRLAVYAELFYGMSDEEIENVVVDAGLCEAVDSRCGRVLEAAVKKVCKAAGLSWESLEFKPYAMWGGLK